MEIFCYEEEDSALNVFCFLLLAPNRFGFVFFFFSLVWLGFVLKRASNGFNNCEVIYMMSVYMWYGDFSDFFFLEDKKRKNMETCQM